MRLREHHHTCLHWKKTHTKKSFEQGSEQECLISWGRKKSGEQKTWNGPPKAAGAFFWWFQVGLGCEAEGWTGWPPIKARSCFSKPECPTARKATFLAVLGLSLSGGEGHDAHGGFTEAYSIASGDSETSALQNRDTRVNPAGDKGSVSQPWLGG